MMSHDIRLSSSHNFTKLLYYIASQPWENTELVIKLAMTLNYGEILKWSNISYGSHAIDES